MTREYLKGNRKEAKNMGWQGDEGPSDEFNCCDRHREEGQLKPRLIIVCRSDLVWPVRGLG